MDMLYEQNLLLWERVESYKSNVAENEAKAIKTCSVVREVGQKAEERRRKAFGQLRNAGKLRESKGEHIETGERADNEAMKTVTATMSKLETVLEEERSRHAKVEASLSGEYKRREEINERKRMLERRTNLEMIEGKLAEWWRSSSRGSRRR